MHNDEMKKMYMLTSYNYLQIYDNIKKANEHKNKEIDFSLFIYSLVSIIHNLYYKRSKISEYINTELNKS